MGSKQLHQQLLRNQVLRTKEEILAGERGGPTPTPELQGRVGAIAVTQADLNIVLIGMYFPTRSGRVNDKVWYVRTVAAIIKWLTNLLATIPKRYTPYFYTDANSDLAPPRGDASTTVVNVVRGKPNEAGTALYKLLEATGMAAYNTFVDPGHTFSRDKAETRIDFVGGPSANLCNVAKCVVLRKAAKDARASRYCDDHYPILCKTFAPLPAAIKRNELRWSYDGLSAALRDPQRRIPFLQDMEIAYEQHRPALETMSMDGVPDRHNDAVFAIINNVGQKHFKNNKTYGPWCENELEKRL